MAMRNRFVRELYELVYKAKDLLTIERGSRVIEQRTMEQRAGVAEATALRLFEPYECVFQPYN
jgi:hypothetical protein